MEGALAVIIGFAISLIFAVLVFMFGSRRKRYDKYPFLSGESLRVGKIQYPVRWIYYVFLLIALDAAVILVAISSYYISLMTAVYLLLISLVLLFIPKAR